MKRMIRKIISAALVCTLMGVQAYAYTNDEWMHVENYEGRQNWQIDRGEFCEYLVKLYDYVTWGKPEPIENPFWDLEEAQHPYALGAYSLGFVKGTDSATFSPKNLVNRAEASVMLLRVVKKMYPQLDTSGGEGIAFPDGAPDWALEALQFMFSRGFTGGHNGEYEKIGAYDPVTLKEAVAMVDKVMRTSQYPVVHPTFDGVKKVYLTFDDAPSQNTVSILNTLRDYEAPATFFVTGKADASILLRMRDEGHAIGNHTLSHDYARIYKSPQAFWNDFDAQGRYLQGVLGYLPTLIRFPGGSNNTVSYNYGGRSVMKTICYQAKQYGYLYFDWNVSSGDADKTTVPKDTIVRNVLNGCKNKTDAVVLMHQSSYKTTTAQALPEIIRGLQDMGFVFVRLNEDSVRPQFLR